MSNILDKIKLSGVTYDIVDSTAIHSMDGYWTSGQTQDAITAATGALAESIAEQHYQTSGDVQNAISGKADTSYVDQSVSGKAETTAVTQSINEAVSGKADANSVITDVSGYTSQVTGFPIKTFVKSTKNNESTSVIAAQFDNNDFTLSNNIISVDDTKFAQQSDIPSVTGYADAVKYNSTSKYVEFYHGGTGGTKVFEYDASPFLIDGMVENVEIKQVTSGGSQVTCLVISFNTAAGKQDINIPISQIFDASNYYTKDEVDAELSGKTDNSAFTAYTATTDTALGNKADTTAMTEAISEATSGKVDTNTYTGYTAATDTALAGKANTADVVTNVSIYTEYSNDNGPKLKYTKNGSDVYEGYLYQTGNGLVYDNNTREISVDTNTIQEKLTSGTNIKTVGGNSLLGSGNIAFPAGLQVEVTGTTLVFG